jgi:hypothetical protein
MAYLLELAVAAFFALFLRMRCLRCLLCFFVEPVLLLLLIVVDELVFCVLPLTAAPAPIVSARASAATILLFMLRFISFNVTSFGLALSALKKLSGATGNRDSLDPPLAFASLVIATLVPRPPGRA